MILFTLIGTDMNMNWDKITVNKCVLQSKLIFLAIITEEFKIFGSFDISIEFWFPGCSRL